MQHIATVTTLQRHSDKYSQKRNCAGLSLSSSIHVSVSDLYIPTIGLPLLLREIVGSWEYINRLQTHEYGNWDLGRAVFTYIIHNRNSLQCRLLTELRR